MNHLVDGPDIDLGLAAAGDAVHQDRLVPPLAERGEDAVQRRLLIGIEQQVLLARRRRFFDLHLLDAADLGLDQLLLPQLADRPERAFGRLGQLRRRQRPRRGGQNSQRIELLLAELERARRELLAALRPAR